MATSDMAVRQACIEALRSAGEKLGMETMELAHRLRDGRIAEVIVELNALRHMLPHYSRERVEDLLREVGGLSD